MVRKLRVFVKPKSKRYKIDTRRRGFYKMVKDKGKPGRGKAFVARRRVKTGILGEGFFSKSVKQQHAILTKRAKRLGERSVQGQLQYVANLQRRTNPKIQKQAQRLRSWVAVNFKGKKKV